MSRIKKGKTETEMQRIRKGEFVDRVIANAFSSSPKSNIDLAGEMGISERQFYNRKKRYAEALNKSSSQLLAYVRLATLGALTRKLTKENVEDNTIALAGNFTGDLGKKVLEGTGMPVDGEEKQQVIINVANINDPKELEKIVEERLRRTRKEIINKSKKKA